MATMNAVLKLAILESGKTQMDIAAEVGVHFTKLSMIVRGHRQPSATEQRRIARVLRRPVHDLFPEVAA